MCVYVCVYKENFFYTWKISPSTLTSFFKCSNFMENREQHSRYVSRKKTFHTLVHRLNLTTIAPQ